MKPILSSFNIDSEEELEKFMNILMNGNEDDLNKFVIKKNKEEAYNTYKQNTFTSMLEHLFGDIEEPDEIVADDLYGITDTYNVRMVSEDTTARDMKDVLALLNEDEAQRLYKALAEYFA